MDPYEKSFITEANNLGSYQQKETEENEEASSDHLVKNGCVNVRGTVADKRRTGGWKAAPFVIANEVAERLAFFAIAVNMVAYLVFEMGQSLPDAATHVTDWIGAAYVLTLLGAFLADAYLGRFKTIVIFSAVYATGMVILTISASLDNLRPPPCTSRPCPKASSGQNGILFCALALIALGTGGIKPCVSSFGADQFDESDEKEVEKKYAFFNWFFFAINMGALLGITIMVYVQDKVGWGWGFGIPTGIVICSIFILTSGIRCYRYQKPRGSPFTRFVQVIVVSVRNHLRGVEASSDTNLYEVKTSESVIVGARKLSHTAQYRFLDKAAVVTDAEATVNNRWRLCTVTQVEEFKSFIRVLPIWASTIALSISFAQLSTFFVSQARLMDRNLGSHFTIPPGSVPVFSAVNALVLVPVYEKLVVPLLRKRTGHPRGLTSLQRMGVGLFISIFATASAVFVEKRRRSHAASSTNLMTVFWVFPQYFLIGSAEVFTYVGQLEFFYDEATEGTRSISSAMFLSEVGIGSWLSTALVKIIGSASGGQQNGWLTNDLNKGKLENFYWILTAINAVNFLVYVVLAWRYKSRNGSAGNVRDESMIEL